MNPCQTEFEKFYAPCRAHGVTFEANDTGGYIDEDVDIAYNIFRAGWYAANQSKEVNHHER